MLTYILFVVGFVLLIKGADMLVDGAASVARRLRVSAIVIGLTIVAFGTSAPELIVNILSSIKGNTDLAMGNILGSNIANIFLILGASALVYPLATKENTVYKEIPLGLLSVIIVGVLANDVWLDGASSSSLTRIDGIVLLSFFIIFLYYTFGIAKVRGEASVSEIQKLSYFKSIYFIVFGLLGLSLGGKWIVDGAVHIAESFYVSQSLIGLTIVALGTSLPELATSLVAAYKKQPDIAIGNVVGSGIFNVFWILGLSATIRPLPISKGTNLDLMVAIFASLLVFVFMFIDKKHIIQRWQGGFLLSCYLVYIFFLMFTR